MASTVDISDKPVPIQGIPAPGHNAIELRRLASTWLPQEGVVGVNDFKAVPGGAAKTISVPAGQAAVEGDSVAEQSRYYCRHTGAAVTLDLATPPDATNPRIDQVVLEVKDDAHDGSGLNTARLRVISGTPTAGATRANRLGAAALPATCVRLLDLLVPAAFNAVFVAGTHFQDRRPFARGNSFSETVVAGTLTNAGAQVVSTSKSMEVGGTLMAASLAGLIRADSPITYQYGLLIREDGVEKLRAAVDATTASRVDHVSVTSLFATTPGIHSYEVYFASVGANGNTVWRSASVPLTWAVEEAVGRVTAP